MKKIILLTATIAYNLYVQNSQQINDFLKYYRPTSAMEERDWDDDLIWMIALDELASSDDEPNIAAIKEDAIYLVGELAEFIIISIADFKTNN